MRIFIGWSKSRARQIAGSLAEWLPTLNPAIEPWWSDGLEAGSRWRNELSRRLRNTRLGIVVVTPEALHSPWLNFEAGALAKAVKAGLVCPYLFGLDPEALKHSPLEEFQGVNADRAGTLKLVEAINRALPVGLGKQMSLLTRAFERKWPELERRLAAVQPLPNEPERDQARRVLERIDRDDQELPAEVSRGLWIPDLFLQIRSRLTLATAAARHPTIELFDINALAPLHAGFEMFLELLAGGGRLRIMMLDPRSEAFAERSALECDEVGRIAAESVASFHILTDLLAHLRRSGQPADLEIRLTAKLPNSAIVLADVDDPAGLVLANPYPTDTDKRGLAYPWYTYSRADGGLYSQYRDEFRAHWKRATRVTVRSTIGPGTEWPFTPEP